MIKKDMNQKKFLEKKNKYMKWDLVLLGICMIFYLIFPIMDGPEWCVDSNGYATLHISREPLYPLFLAFSRKIESLLCI